MWRPFHTHPCPCPCRVKGNPALEQNVGRCTRRSASPAWDSKLCVMLAMTVMLLMLGWWWWWWWSWCYDDDQPSSPLAPLPLSLSTPPLLDNNQHIGLYYISIVNYRWLKNRNSNNNKDRLVVQWWCPANYDKSFPGPKATGAANPLSMPNFTFCDYLIMFFAAVAHDADRNK